MPKLGFTSITMHEDDLERIDRLALKLLDQTPKEIVEKMSPAEKVRLFMDRLEAKENG